MAIRYRLTIMVPEELDQKINSKVIPLLTNKHRVIIHAISKGIDYLTANNLLEHKSDRYYFERRLPYNILEVGLSDNPEQQALKARIKELSIKFNQPARVIGYNALIRGIEHG